MNKKFLLISNCIMLATIIALVFMLISAHNRTVEGVWVDVDISEGIITREETAREVGRALLSEQFRSLRYDPNRRVPLDVEENNGIWRVTGPSGGIHVNLGPVGPVGFVEFCKMNGRVLRIGTDFNHQPRRD